MSNKTIKSVSTLLLTLVLLSCSTIKHKKQGFVSQKEFETQITFKNTKDLIFIPVTIENKHYNFIFDTGAELNIIDPTIASELHLKTLTKSTLSSTENKQKGIPVVEINQLEIGGIQFHETVGMIWDLSKLSKFIGCSKIDGIIGNNLMRKTNWQIDYAHKSIKISDKINSFTISKDAIKIDFAAKKHGNVLLPIKLNGTAVNLTFDTGYNGFIETAKNEIISPNNHITTVGFTGANFNGQKNDGKTNYCNLQTFQIKNFEFNCPSAILVKENNSSLLGNEFFKHFTLTMDWQNHCLYLDPQAKIDFLTTEVFELSFYADFSKNEILVGNIVEGKELKHAIKTHSKVVEIEGHDVSSLTQEELCEFWNTTWINLKKQDKLNVTIENEGANQKSVIEKIKFSTN